MSLFAQGFRFVLRAGRFDWVHPADVLPSDLDCTDMEDEEFTAVVIASEATHSTEGKV